MKKMMFAAIAALVLGIGFTACGMKATSPGERVIEALEEVLNFCKTYQVNTAEDAIQFEKQFAELETELDKKYGDLDELEEKNLTPEEQQRINELSDAINNEMNRLLRQSAALGADINDFVGDDDLDIDDFVDNDDVDLDIDLDDIEDALEEAADDISDII